MFDDDDEEETEKRFDDQEEEEEVDENHDLRHKVKNADREDKKSKGNWFWEQQVCLVL